MESAEALKLAVAVLVGSSSAMPPSRTGSSSIDLSACDQAVQPVTAGIRWSCMAFSIGAYVCCVLAVSSTLCW